ncbi:hypothetical protein GE061_002553 [Apolygus lucorum]|uniref:Slingshot N-terminal domain-containing protein n=1 Tax=Apolygus lucorum TaxID=248454 RepID=A0A6A4IXS9_APOLU|nr:hypothetical protein GE061_002553 [Apolygus lucorum]
MMKSVKPSVPEFFKFDRISILKVRLFMNDSNCYWAYSSFQRNSLFDDSGAGGSLDDDDTTKNGRSLSECYFAGKGAAVVLPQHHDRLPPSPAVPALPSAGSDIQYHLQSMFYLLRPEETLKMAVKLESVHAGRTRYLVVVSRLGRQGTEESCLLGIDCNHETTVGLVLKVLADTAITLDGDGGFSVSVCGRQHIFKPVSVQAMW